MKIGIYGGTFNPPHLGHLTAVRAAVEQLGLDRLLLIPAALPPHKPLPQETPAPEHRLAMAEKMADALQLPGVAEVSDIELLRQGKSYTADTLTAIHAQFPQAQLWLLVGGDIFLTLHQWHDPATVLRLARVCVFARTSQEGEAAFAPQAEYLERTFGARCTTLHLDAPVEVSSTQLRERLRQGGGGEGLLPAVYGHILMNRLYGTKADLKHLALPELRACSYAMIQNKRVAHVMGVEEESVKLALRWGADPELARHAGILHDCTKYLGREEQLALCTQNGIEIDELERQAVKLLHAKTGACIARDIFGEPDQVYRAIECHTTAKEEMQLLDKILYLADYIEPNRAFDGVEQLRALAYQDIDKALLLGVETTIEEMQQRQLPVHKNTLMARDWLRRQGVTTGE